MLESLAGRALSPDREATRHLPLSFSRGVVRCAPNDPKWAFSGSHASVGACPGRRAPARRRHDGADPCQRQDGDWAHLELCPGRSFLRQPGAARGPLLRPSGPQGRASAHHLRAYSGILQADAFGGYNGLYEASRSPGAITPALVVHARRGFFELADIAAKARRGQNAAVNCRSRSRRWSASTPCSISSGVSIGLSVDERLEVRTEQSVPLVADLELS